MNNITYKTQLKKSLFNTKDNKLIRTLNWRIKIWLQDFFIDLYENDRWFNVSMKKIIKD